MNHPPLDSVVDLTRPARTTHHRPRTTCIMIDKYIYILHTYTQRRTLFIWRTYYTTSTRGSVSRVSAMHTGYTIYSAWHIAIMLYSIVTALHDHIAILRIKLYRPFLFFYLIQTSVAVTRGKRVILANCRVFSTPYKKAYYIMLHLHYKYSPFLTSSCNII